MGRQLPKGIRVRGGSLLVDVTVNGIRKTATCESMEAALLKRAELYADLLGGVVKGVTGVAVWTMQKAFEKAKETAWAGTAGEVNALRNAQEAVEYFRPGTTLDKVTVDRIDEYVVSLRTKGNSNATINRKLAALSKMFTIAVDRGGAPAKPRIERKRESQGRIRFLTQQEERTALSLLEQWGKDEHAEAFCILIDTGLRPSELWRLAARDLNYVTETPTLTIWKTKTNKPRTIPMTQRVADIMRRRMELHPNGTGLFPDAGNFWFEHVWDRLKDHMGLQNDPQFVPYTLRHTCASRLVQRGVHLKVVQEWMGHAAIQTTMIYAHLAPTNLIDAVRVLEAV